MTHFIIILLFFSNLTHSMIMKYLPQNTTARLHIQRQYLNAKSFDLVKQAAFTSAALMGQGVGAAVVGATAGTFGTIGGAGWGMLLTLIPATIDYKLTGKDKFNKFLTKGLAGGMFLGGSACYLAGAYAVAGPKGIILAPLTTGFILWGTSYAFDKRKLKKSKPTKKELFNDLYGELKMQELYSFIKIIAVGTLLTQYTNAFPNS